jgi:hypothetical protein
MYLITLLLHSWLRWAVLAVGIWAFVRALSGMAGRRTWAPADESAGRWFTVLMDVQLLLGLLLYGLLSPITRQAFADMGAAMREPATRFWAVEHVALMILAVVLAHIGRGRARRARTDAGRHRTSAIFYGLALVAMLAAIPWPFMADPRPLVRLP